MFKNPTIAGLNSANVDFGLSSYCLNISLTCQSEEWYDWSILILGSYIILVHLIITFMKVMRVNNSNIPKNLDKQNN